MPTNVQNVIEIIKEMNLHNASLSGMFVIYSAISIAIVTITGGISNPWKSPGNFKFHVHFLMTGNLHISLTFSDTV